MLDHNARKKKRRNNPVTQQLQRAAETYSVDQTHVIVRGGTCPHNTLGKL